MLYILAQKVCTAHERLDNVGWGGVLGGTNGGRHGKHHVSWAFAQPCSPRQTCCCNLSTFFQKNLCTNFTIMCVCGRCLVTKNHRVNPLADKYVDPNHDSCSAPEGGGHPSVPPAVAVHCLVLACNVEHTICPVSREHDD